MVQVENRFWDLRPLLGPLTLQLNFTSRHPPSVFKTNKGTPDGVWLGELVGVLCLVLRQLFPWRMDALSSRPRKWHQIIYTQALHSKKNFKIKIICIHCQPRTPSTIAMFPKTCCLCRVNQRNPVMMHSSGENGRVWAKMRDQSQIQWNVEE